MVGMTLPRRFPQRKPPGQHPDNALTPLFVRNVSRAGRYCDGQGLYLEVRPSGSRGWIQRLTIRGRRAELGLGGFPLVSLKEAREKAFANRKLAREGGDPLSEKRRASSTPTFAEATRQVWKQLRPGWRSPQHAQLWLSSLERYALPRIGGMPVFGSDQRRRDRDSGSDLARHGGHRPQVAPAHPRGHGVGGGDGSAARQPLRPDRSGAGSAGQWRASQAGLAASRGGVGDRDGAGVGGEAGGEAGLRAAGADGGTLREVRGGGLDGDRPRRGRVEHPGRAHEGESRAPGPAVPSCLGGPGGGARALSQQSAGVSEHGGEGRSGTRRCRNCSWS